MTQFYLRQRKDTLAQKVAPKLPQGFFKTEIKKDFEQRQKENEQIAQEYEQLYEDKWAQYEIAV